MKKPFHPARGLDAIDPHECLCCHHREYRATATSRSGPLLVLCKPDFDDCLKIRRGITQARTVCDWRDDEQRG